MNRLLLLVEDSPTDEKLTIRALQKSGVTHRIAVARDGVEAIDYLGVGGVKVAGATDLALPAVILLDLKLPRVDGLEVLRRIRGDERTRLVPVVVLTASNEDGDVTQSFASGANAYVRKPVDFTEFEELARTLARFWLDFNEVVPPPRALP